MNAGGRGYRRDLVLGGWCVRDGDAQAGRQAVQDGIEALKGVWWTKGGRPAGPSADGGVCFEVLVPERTWHGAVRARRRIAAVLRAAADRWALPPEEAIGRLYDPDPAWAARTRERYLAGEARRAIAASDGTSLVRVQRATGGLARPAYNRPARRLGEAEVVRIRERRRGGESCLALGRELGMSDVAVRKLVRGITYREAPGALDAAQDDAITRRERAKGYRDTGGRGDGR